MKISDGVIVYMIPRDFIIFSLDETEFSFVCSTFDVASKSIEGKHVRLALSTKPSRPPRPPRPPRTSKRKKKKKKKTESSRNLSADILFSKMAAMAGGRIQETRSSIAKAVRLYPVL